MGPSDANGTLSDSIMSNISSSINPYKEIRHVVTCVIISLGLLLTPVAIYAVYSLVRKDNVAPIYVINLLVSDLVQLCFMIVIETRATKAKTNKDTKFKFLPLYFYGMMVSVGFMVCIALERYLVIAWPLWYRQRRTIKATLGVCALVWTLPLVYILLFYTWDDFENSSKTVFGVFLLLPFPLLIFFLAGTFKALSAAVSVRTEEKRRIVGLLVLVLLIYTLLFLPGIIFLLVACRRDRSLSFVSFVFFKLNPLADLFLYIFLRKGAVNKILGRFCYRRKNSASQQSCSGENDPNTYLASST